ncbi:hypothetical protein WH47_07368 [Habropoda laboriosa]|uniref:Uncharacterized protein n=1 Tax=Habropoda laboriosa TaxID=597456 RepID=A0A0L7R641_9HYME|nr:hypothetical protein WH47_07368 [Habropoda laboriosa]
MVTINTPNKNHYSDKKIDIQAKTICTQTSLQAIQLNEKNLQDKGIATDVNRFTSSCIQLEDKKSSAFWCTNNDPAPQWLIEEALNREAEVCKEYETMISNLEAKLAQTRQELEEAITAKLNVKEKYKRYLENAKTEAREENEVLQEKIVRICTSVLENFGPRSLDRRGNICYQIKYRRRLKCHERISTKLHTKLRMAVAKSTKLKRELAAARKTVKNKSEEYESISKCFGQLKQEMEVTETNLNNLIAENLSLRKKMEDTRDWLQHTVGKERHTAHFRDMHKNRELTSLKKKVEEDSATIAQLRNKLVRSESANANKGFLLNSYKSQLADLNKEKTQLMSRLTGLENQISAVRNSNSQLKGKISVLNFEKDKLLTDNEKSKTNITQKMETKCDKKCEETVQYEVETIRSKYEETIKSMNTKMAFTKNQNNEYSKAIKEFLKKLYEHHRNHKTPRSSYESDASEKEAHETACNILNMTPDELTGFINGKASNSTNPWLVELNRIIATSYFSENLSMFLLKKTMKKVKI